jgi:2-oxoglutarate dehydrogenase E2 component (dihydrolipoamide succinyltransferase)
MLRRKVAERLVSAKNETAMLTTFNEVNMTPINLIRNEYKEAFKETCVSLGYVFLYKSGYKSIKIVSGLYDGWRL